MERLRWLLRDPLKVSRGITLFQLEKKFFIVPERLLRYQCKASSSADLECAPQQAGEFLQRPGLVRSLLPLKPYRFTTLMLQYFWKYLQHRGLTHSLLPWKYPSYYYPYLICYNTQDDLSNLQDKHTGVFL